MATKKVRHGINSGRDSNVKYDSSRYAPGSGDPNKISTWATPKAKPNYRGDDQTWQSAYEHMKMESLRELALKKKPSKRR